MVQSQLRVLLAQDPVHARILELVVENATAPDIAMYTKLNLIEHKASHQVSVSLSPEHLPIKKPPTLSRL